MKTIALCPVCAGRGIVPAGFYQSTGLIWTSPDATPQQCRSCKGKGYIVVERRNL